MKHSTYLIFAFSALASSGVWAGDADPVIENTLEARRLVKDASAEYNIAVAMIVNSDAILRDNVNRAANVSRDFAGYDSECDAIVKRLDSAKDRMRLLKENYKQGTAALAFARDNLTFANNAFPMGDKRYELADSLYRTGSEAAAKNPGKNYEDKRYFESVWSSYSSAKARFLSAQKDAAKLVLALSIANPRMEGIEATLKLAEDFLEKTAKSAAENKSVANEMREKVQGLYDDSMKAYEELTAQMRKLADVRSGFTKASFALSAFIMNDLPKNEKYYDTIFKADPSFLNAVGTGGRSFESMSFFGKSSPASDASAVESELAVGSSFGFDGMDSAPAPVQLKSRSAAAQANAARPLSSDLFTIPSKPENIREEIFNACMQINNLAAEILQANALLSDIVAEAGTSLRAVETSENEANALLRSVIGFFTEAQANSSELQIFKNSMGVTISQSAVSSNEFKKLCENADKAIKACSENTLKIGEKLETAKAALK